MIPQDSPSLRFGRAVAKEANKKWEVYNDEKPCYEEEDRCNDCPIDYPQKECPEFKKEDI